MIEINLLPGTGKKSKSRGGLSFKGFSGAATKVKDPYLLSAVATMLVAVGVVGFMHWTQSSTAGELTSRETVALQDSARYAIVLAERHEAEAKRDSVLRQLAIIRSIDNERYVWPHVLDEVSRALPPYTWIKSINQTSAPTTPEGPAKDKDGKGDAAPAAPAGQPAAPAPSATPEPPPGQPVGSVAARKPVEPRDPEPVIGPMRFRLVGHTVDIQALTRFMKLLELSPFVQNVQLAKSEMVMLDGKEVTEFHLDAEYEKPDRSVITTAPVSLSVR
jgi:Tfp pilus assembly protein PilN